MTTYVFNVAFKHKNKLSNFKKIYKLHKIQLFLLNQFNVI